MTPTTKAPWAWRELHTPLGSLRIECGIDGFFDTQVIDSLTYTQLACERSFQITLGDSIRHEMPDVYRRAMFARGIYLGHNLGPRGDVAASANNIAVNLLDADVSSYRRALWAYAIKVYLSVVSLAEGLLHVKGATVLDGHGRATLLSGRGQGGKSTLATELALHDFHLAGNTHAIIGDRHVWAINGWTRIRVGSEESYIPPLPPQSAGDGPLRRVVLVDHNTRGDFICLRLDPARALGFCMQFVAATGAYDLKEDLADIWGGWSSIESHFAAELAAMQECLRACPIYYLSADIMAADSRSATLDFLHGD